MEWPWRMCASLDDKGLKDSNLSLLAFGGTMTHLCVIG